MDPLFDFTGKVVVVTGGSRGLGAAMVRAFAARGADVVIASRKIESCEALAAEVRGMGRRALPFACNVSHWADNDALADAAYAEYGRVDILINNAGLSPLAPSSHETSEALFDKIVAVNFKGPFRLSSLIASRMVEGDGGCIINISSTGAVMPMPAVVPYSGAKAAINNMTIAMAREYAPKVRINCIMPGAFMTDIAKAWPKGAEDNLPNGLRRGGQPEEIVTAALYLASPASRYTSGTVHSVDGGPVR